MSPLTLLLLCIFLISANAGTNRIGTIANIRVPQILSEPWDEERITLGEPVDAQPFAGSLVFYVNGKYGAPFCTSSLIAPDVVLTAAHCFPPDFNNKQVQLKFVYGLSDVREQSINDHKDDPDVNVIAFDYNKDVIMHPNYIGSSNLFEDDIALIKLPQKVTAPQLKIMKLAKREYLDNIHGVGWGLKNCTHGSPETLRKAKAEILTQSDCSEKLSDYRKGDPIPDSQICTFYTAMGTQAAVSSGDSGGPLYQDSQNPIQIGVLSHGFFYPHNYEPPMNWRCINPNLPQVYIRVSAYQSWIESFVPEAEFV